MKYGCYLTYKQEGYIEVEADSEEEAKELALERVDDAQFSSGSYDDDFDVEVEELE